MPAQRSFQHIFTLILFALGILLFCFVAPSLMGLAMLAAIALIPVAILAVIGWLVWKSAAALRKPAEAAQTEAEAE